MTCYRPNIILQDFNAQTEKGRPVTRQFISSCEAEQKSYEYYEKQNKIIEPNGFKYTRIPCGQCIGCKRDYTNGWSQRLMHEAKTCKDNWFLTITYDEEHKPYYDTFPNPKTGEVYEDDGTWNGYLRESDMQKYLKRIRENWYRKEKEYYKEDNPIKYYYCGEYGGTTRRPHYHMIIYNLPIADLKEYLKEDKLKPGQKMLWCSTTLEELWGMGRVMIGKVEQESANYVAGYCQKKMFGYSGALRHELHAKAGQTEEYTRMSKRPAIGLQWYKEHKNEIYENDEVIVKRGDKQVSVKPSKYYDRLYDIEYPEDMERIKKERRHRAEKSAEAKAKNSTYTIKEQLEIDEMTAIKQTQHWLRGKVDAE